MDDRTTQQAAGASKPGPGPTPEPLTADEQRQRDHDTVAGAVLAGVFATAIHPGVRLHPQKLKNYRDQVLQDAGITDDPLQRMLAETITAAHARILHLHGKAGEARDPEATAILSDSAAKLMAEMRRCVESLAKTRAAATPKESTVTYRICRGDDEDRTKASVA